MRTISSAVRVTSRKRPTRKKYEPDEEDEGVNKICNVLVHTVAAIRSHTPCHRPHAPPSKPYSGTTHDINNRSCVTRYCKDMDEIGRAHPPRAICIQLARRRWSRVYWQRDSTNEFMSRNNTMRKTHTASTTGHVDKTTRATDYVPVVDVTNTIGGRSTHDIVAARCASTAIPTGPTNTARANGVSTYYDRESMVWVN